MPHDLVIPEEIDRQFGWPVGRAASLARRGVLPHYLLPNGDIRFRLPELITQVRRVPAASSTAHQRQEVAHAR